MVKSIVRLNQMRLKKLISRTFKIKVRCKKASLKWCVLSLLRKIETDGAALMSYGRQFHIAGAEQRKASDLIFVWDEHGSSCTSSAEV